MTHPRTIDPQDTHQIGRLARLSCRLFGHKIVPLTQVARISPLRERGGSRPTTGWAVIGRGCTRCGFREFFRDARGGGEK